MGSVISKTAAADDIVRDAQTTHEQGVARGGRIQEIVEDRLGSTLPLVLSITAERQPLVAQIVTLRAHRDTAVERAIATVSECSDILWNRVGRPGSDPRFDLVFPGGASAYTTGPMESFPNRIAVLEDLLGRGLHPQITAELVAEWRPRLEAARTEVATANEALLAPVAHESVLERSYYAVVRNLQTGLASVKRDLKSEGLSESQIHEIIPDRPRATPKSAPSEPVSPPNGAASPVPAGPTTS